jgi:hypothetical protein
LNVREDLFARIRPRPFRSRLRVRDRLPGAPVEAPSDGR